MSPYFPQTYTIDPWGNLQESGTYTFSQVIGANNRISPGQGYLYDSAGNQTQDGLGNTYQYRADGLMTGSNGVTYTYDALGQRVRKSGSASNEYIYFGGQLLAMRNPTTGAWTDRIYGPTGALATVPGTQTGAPVYRAVDHLGSLNYTLDASGNITGVSSALPYGELVVNSTADNFLFTDHERDSENGTDATLYRHYASTEGRWLSPDPSNGSYNLLDPQSLNRYAYVTNRPMAKVDQLGLDDDDDDDDDDSGWWGDDDDDDDGGGGGWGPPPAYDTSSYDTGTTQPDAGPAYAEATFYAFGTPYGVSNSPWNVVDASPGLDRDGTVEIPDGMADSPYLYGMFHDPTQGQPFWGGANKVVTYATVGYTTAVAAVPAVGATVTAVAGLAARGIGAYLATAGTATVAVIGKFPEYIDDAEEIGARTFSMPSRVYNMLDYFNQGWTANQEFLDRVVQTGQQIRLSTQPLGQFGGYGLELDYLESIGVGPDKWKMIAR